MKRLVPLLLVLCAALPAHSRPRKVIVRSGVCSLDGRRYSTGDRARRLKNNAGWQMKQVAWSRSKFQGSVG